MRVGRVTFGGDALVPIVIGKGRILQLDRLQPRVLARGLVKVTVDAKALLHRSRSVLKPP